MKIDFLIFGNGYGLGAPRCEQSFHWLKDTRTGKCAMYHEDGWFGAQLVSFQWFNPQVGERRRLLGREFVAVSARRRWLRVSISWSQRLSEDTDQANKFLHKFFDDLRNLRAVS
jgi:hypothetical protein